MEISFGLTTLYEILKDNNELKNESQIDIFIIPINTKKQSLKLANDIRKLGFKVDIEMNDKKLKKSLNFANKMNIPFVVILGEDEIKNESFSVKDMINNKEYKIQMNNIKQLLESSTQKI